MMYSDDVLKTKASPKLNMNSKQKAKDKSNRKIKQSKLAGKSPMTVEVVAAIQAAEQEAAEIEAMQKRERLLIRAMIGGFLLLVLGLARQHNPDDPSLRGSEWQGDHPSMAQHLTMESSGGINSPDIETIASLPVSLEEAEEEEEEEVMEPNNMDLVEYTDSLDTVSGNSQDANEMESIEELNESLIVGEEEEELLTASEDSEIASESGSRDELIPSGEEEYSVDQMDGRWETAEEEGGN